MQVLCTVVDIKGFIDDIEVLNFSLKGDDVIVQFLIHNEHIIIFPLIVWTIYKHELWQCAAYNFIEFKLWEELSNNLISQTSLIQDAEPNNYN